MTRKLLARIASLAIVFVMFIAPASTVWAQDPTPTPEVLSATYVNVSSTLPKFSLGQKEEISIAGMGFTGGQVPLTVNIVDASSGGTITSIPITAIVLSDGTFNPFVTWTAPLALFTSNTYRVEVKVLDSAGKQLNPSGEGFDIDFATTPGVRLSGPDEVHPGETVTFELEHDPMGVVNHITISFKKPDGSVAGEVELDVPVSELLTILPVTWTVPDLSDKYVDLTITDELGRKLNDSRIGVAQPDLTGQNPTGSLTISPTRVQNGQPVSFNLTGAYFKPNAEVFIMVQEDQGEDREWVPLGIADGSGNINASVTWTPQAFHPGNYRLFVTWEDQQGQTDVIPVQAGDHEISITLSEQALALQLGVADAIKNDPDLINQIAAAVKIPEGAFVTEEQMKTAIQAAINEVTSTNQVTPTPAPAYDPKTDPAFQKLVREEIALYLIEHPITAAAAKASPWPTIWGFLAFVLASIALFRTRRSAETPNQ